MLHLFSTVCVCANIFVVSIITFVSVWGSGKALRGKDGSSEPSHRATPRRTKCFLWPRILSIACRTSASAVGMVVEGMNKERWLIFYTFGIGLLSLLIAVACSTWLLMQREIALIATVMLLATCYALVSNAIVRRRRDALSNPAASARDRAARWDKSSRYAVA
eukprot:3392576-Prymnesium_polylepis.1